MQRSPSCLALAGVVMLLALSPESAIKRSCDDPIPEDCKKTKPLGEKEGCACFECNPGTKHAKTVCTKSESNKKMLFDKAERKEGFKEE